MKLHIIQTVSERRKAIETLLKVSLVHTGSYSLDETAASEKHCENMIGVTQVPFGIAGPLCIGKTEYYIPLSTTEGALVASVNRGCKAICQSGGATVDSYLVGTSRGPVFYVKNIQESDQLNTFIDAHLKEMKRIARATSSHITLMETCSRGVGQYRFVRCVYDTKDAMGMNMVTIATENITQYIQEQTGISCVSLSGNYCVDKKPSWLNVIEGRGYKAWAEVEISHKILENTLKTTARRIYDVWVSKCLMGSIMSGSMGYNAQYANVLAALFLATGQDIAHVAECSVGVTTAEVRGKNLYMSVYLPDLMAGTVGGGTELATQKEALQLLGVYGGNDGKNKKKFVEIIGASVLAGEISLLASLSEGTLAKAHRKLARGKSI
jgi:hydroxymethylglutaryl-CoA reductase (NADPH)